MAGNQYRQKYDCNDAPFGKRLALATLFLALEHKKSCGRKRKGKSCPDCKKDTLWVEAEEDLTNPFSFCSVCQLLGLTPELVRNGFRSMELAIKATEGGEL